jgi:hypothetical protein
LRSVPVSQQVGLFCCAADRRCLAWMTVSVSTEDPS